MMKPEGTSPEMPPGSRRIVLGSASPRRREIFRLLGIPHEVASPDVDEGAIASRTARELAIKTAYTKACALEPNYPEGTLVIAADTVVAMDNDVFPKPAGAAEAQRMLQQLSGRTHSVITGLAVKEAGSSTLLDAVETRVEMRELTIPEIDAYIATGEPLDKAGAYAVQGSLRVVQTLHGDYFNVVGLPVAKLLEMMSLSLDVTPYQLRLPELAASALVPDWVHALRG